MAKYKFTGKTETHFPSLGVTVKEGEVIEANTEINHPDFELVKSKSEEKREAVQKGEEK